MTGPLQFNEPFVLLDFEGRRQLYRRPSRIIEIRDPRQIASAIEEFRGRTVAGFMGYESGYALEPRLRHLCHAPAPGDPPLLWFGVFPEGPEPAPELADGMGAWVGAPEP